MNFFGARRDRFTLQNLRRLTDILRNTPASGFSRATSTTVVETFREIAELMIYGDQHDPGFFDVFVEQRVMAHFTKFVAPPGPVGTRPNREIALQLLQTLAIVIKNIREETSLFFLFSEQHVPRRVVEADLDFADEEILARYVSLLKTISLRLNERTVQMFFFTGVDDDGDKSSGTKKLRAANESTDALNAQFPLFAAAVDLLSHHESMVRAESRQIVLNCLAVDDKRVRAFLLSPKPWRRCIPLAVQSAGATVAALTDTILFAQPSQTGARERGNLLAELSDLLSFVDDAVGLREVDAGDNRKGDGETEGETREEENTLAERVENELWFGLIQPTLLESIVEASVSETAEYLGSTKISPDGNDDENATRDAGPPKTSHNTALFAVSRVAVSCRRGNTLRRVTNALFGFEPGTDQRPNRRREFLLKALGGVQGAPVAAAAVAACASLSKATTDKASDLNETLLDVGVAPPATKRNETENGTDHERVAARTEVCDALAASLARSDPGLPLGARRCAAWLLSRIAGGAASTSARASIDVASSLAVEAVRRAIDGPWGDACVSTFIAEWVSTRRETQHPSLQDETVASWIRGAASEDARQEPSTSGEPVLEESAAAASALLNATRELALLVMLRESIDAGDGDSKFPVEPPAYLFGDTSAVDRVVFGVSGSEGDARGDETSTPFSLAKAPAATAGDDRWMEIKEGTEMAFPTVKFPCRVAFEAGRERSVHLVVAARSRTKEEKTPGVAAAALLLEALPVAGDENKIVGQNVSTNRGVVRAVAPLGACDAFIDPPHKKWLRVRVRSPYSCFHAARQSPGSLDGPYTEKRLRKKLRDGHWTLAFADEQTCADARNALEEGAKTLRTACRTAMAPVLTQEK